ncbi:MAG: type I DNA topoisomerase [Clostridiales bacterium]|nr:type I DNA topoisomerase [Clostridiales bacterium]
MSKNLVIVESPAKAKTIERFLGKDYKVTATIGHFRDLPDKTMGVNTAAGYKPLYIDKNIKVKRELINLAKDADRVYIATDPDREGEAIAWHVALTLKIDPETDCRVTFNEITKKVVMEAIAHPRPIDMDLVNAQQARRVLDRLVGYELSPLLHKKITGNRNKKISAGRVQSAVTKIVMDRDDEIAAFIPEDYWLISELVTTGKKKDAFRLKYFGTRQGDSVDKPKNGRIMSESRAKEIMENIKDQDLKVTSVKKSEGARKPAPPFTTSTMQQEASRRLGFSTAKTTKVAQELYQGVEISGLGQTALVTYIRTDSVRISEEAVAASRSLIFENFGKEFVCPYKRQYKNKNSSQDAHEAIRPSHFDLSPESVKASLTNDQYKLYKLIWERFLASQMADAKLDVVTLDAEVNGEIFRAQGETIVFQGFLKIYGDLKEDKEGSDKNVIPEVSENDTLKALESVCEGKQTVPPPHFTEASLVRAMEETGIGRPSTYSSTISTILDRKYVEKEGKELKITDFGRLVTRMVEDNFHEIADVSFTANMEEKLDLVESGKNDWVSVLDGFYPGFHEQIKAAEKNIEEIQIEKQKIGEICPECGKGELVISEGRNGRFIACSCYPECTYTRNIEVKAKGSCPLCGSGLLVKKTKKGHKNFYVCDKKGKDPECEFISWDLPADGKKCTECGSYMVWKRFRGKVYPKCSNPDCVANKKKKASSES